MRNKIIKTLEKLIGLTQALQAQLPTDPKLENVRRINDHLERAKIELARALREAESN